MLFENVINNKKLYYFISLFLLFIPLFTGGKPANIIILCSILFICLGITFFHEILLKNFKIVFIIAGFSIFQLILALLLTPVQGIYPFLAMVIIFTLLSLIFVKLFSVDIFSRDSRKVRIRDLLFILIFIYLFKISQFRITLNHVHIPRPFYFAIFYNIMLINMIILLFRWSGLSLQEMGLKYNWRSHTLLKSSIYLITGLLTFIILLNTIEHTLPFTINKYRNFLYQIILTGFPEELLFRGILLYLLKDYLENNSNFVSKKFTAVVISAFLFGAMHFSSLTNVLWATTGGIIFGLIRNQEKNIYVITLLHSIYNTLN